MTAGARADNETIAKPALRTAADCRNEAAIRFPTGILSIDLISENLNITKKFKW